MMRFPKWRRLSGMLLMAFAVCGVAAASTLISWLPARSLTLNDSTGRLALGPAAERTPAVVSEPAGPGFAGGGAAIGRVAPPAFSAGTSAAAGRDRDRTDAPRASSSSSRRGSQLVATATGQRRSGPGGAWTGSPGTASSFGARRGDGGDARVSNRNARGQNRAPRPPASGGAAAGGATPPAGVGAEHTVTVGDLVTGAAATGAGDLGTSLAAPGGGTPMASTPEPSSLLLIGSGMAAVAAIRRRRR